MFVCVPRRGDAQRSWQNLRFSIIHSKRTKVLIFVLKIYRKSQFKHWFMIVGSGAGRFQLITTVWRINAIQTNRFRFVSSWLNYWKRPFCKCKRRRRSRCNDSILQQQRGDINQSNVVDRTLLWIESENRTKQNISNWSLCVCLCQRAHWSIIITVRLEIHQ